MVNAMPLGMLASLGMAEIKDSKASQDWRGHFQAHTRLQEPLSHRSLGSHVGHCHPVEPKGRMTYRRWLSSFPLRRADVGLCKAPQLRTFCRLFKAEGIVHGPRGIRVPLPCWASRGCIPLPLCLELRILPPTLHLLPRLWQHWPRAAPPRTRSPSVSFSMTALWTITVPNPSQYSHPMPSEGSVIFVCLVCWSVPSA